MARILIVDDSKFMRRIIRETLESAGHVVAGEADNGYEGLKMFKELKPQVVTMDITMMGKDGLKTVDELIEFDPNAKIIIISAMNEKVLLASHGSAIPVVGFLQKPFEKEDLLAMVAKSL